MKEYDLVELITNKPQYNREGVFKGMFGAVMSKKIMDGKWLISFGEFYTGKDIANILVDEKDLQIYESIPEDRYPPRN